MSHNTYTSKDMMRLHLLVVIWGFTAILGKLISIPSVEVVFYRTLFAAIGLYFILLYRKIDWYVPRKYLIRILGIGVLMAAHWIFFFAAARVSTVSICLAGMATTSLWTSFIEPILLKRRIYKHEVFLGLIIIFGLYVIFRFEFNHALGLTFGIISALLAATFSVLNSKISKQFNHKVITFYEMIGASISITLFFPIYSNLIMKEPLQLTLSTNDFLWLILLAGVCTVYAYSEWVELMKRMSAFTSNLVVNLEPVYGIVLAVIIFGDSEKMAPGFYLGTAIILFSVTIYPFLNRQLKRRKIPN